MKTVECCIILNPLVLIDLSGFCYCMKPGVADTRTNDLNLNRGKYDKTLGSLVLIHFTLPLVRYMEQSHLELLL